MHATAAVPQSSRGAGLFLYTRFESVQDFHSGAEIGMEALLRARIGERHFSPAELFSRQSPLGLPVQADAQARLVHLRNYALGGPQRSALFLNVLPESALADVADPDAFMQQLQQHEIAPREVVIEISERPCTQRRALRRAIAGYRVMGCQIALDDFGAQGLEDRRLAELAPDILKLDRCWLEPARPIPPWLQRSLRRAHACGVLLCAEGIETQAHLDRAMALGASSGQGFGLSQLLPSASMNSAA